MHTPPLRDIKASLILIGKETIKVGENFSSTSPKDTAKAIKKIRQMLAGIINSLEPKI